MELLTQLAPYVIALIAVIIGIISKIRHAKTGKEIMVVVSNAAPDIFERVQEILTQGKMIKNARSQSSEKPDSKEV